MLTVRDLATLPDLELPVAAGAKGLGNAVSWLHVSELADPTRWLEGGELLLTTGLGLGEAATSQRAYVRRLAKHGIAGLGFGIGFGFAEVPAAVVQEADKLSFPVLAVPYEVPFVAITKSAFTHLANEQLEQQTRALAVHERLADAVIRGRGVQALLAIVCSHLDCSLALVDEHGRVLGERHARRRASFDDALELPVVADGEPATLRAAREGRPFEEYDLLVLHHGQTALAFELSRRRAVSAAELRLAGDLLEDLEGERLDERETGRRMAAFGLEPARAYAALLAAPRDGLSGEQVRREIAEELDRRRVRYLSTARRDRATFLVEAAGRGRGYRAGRAPRQGRVAGACRRRAARSRPRPRPEPAGGAGGTRRRRRRRRLVPRPGLARAVAQPAERRPRGIRRPRARARCGQRAADGLAGGAARLGLPLERRGRGARRAQAYAPLPHGAVAGADGASPGRSG